MSDDDVKKLERERDEAMDWADEFCQLIADTGTKPGLQGNGEWVDYFDWLKAALAKYGEWREKCQGCSDADDKRLCAACGGTGIIKKGEVQ